MTADRPYIDAISHECGPRFPIDELPGLSDRPGALDYMKSNGLARFSRFDEPAWPLIERSVGRTLEKAGLKSGDVDAIVLFSTTLDAYEEYADLNRMAVRLGMSRAIPYGMFYNQCTNYSQALELATFLGQAGKREVLIIGYDALDEARWKRLMDNEVSVFSDVIVTALVSRDRARGYRIDGVFHRHQPELTALPPLLFIGRYAEAFRSICRDAYAGTTTTRDDFAYFVPANYNRAVLHNQAELAGLGDAKLFSDNLADYAHCFAADQLISLESLAGTGAMQSGQRALLVAVGGFVLFSGIVVTRA